MNKLCVILWCYAVLLIEVTHQMGLRLSRRKEACCYFALNGAYPKHIAFYTSEELNYHRIWKLPDRAIEHTCFPLLRQKLAKIYRPLAVNEATYYKLREFFYKQAQNYRRWSGCRRSDIFGEYLAHEHQILPPKSQEHFSWAAAPPVVARFGTTVAIHPQMPYLGVTVQQPPEESIANEDTTTEDFYATPEDSAEETHHEYSNIFDVNFRETDDELPLVETDENEMVVPSFQDRFGGGTLPPTEPPVEETTSDATESLEMTEKEFYYKPKGSHYERSTTDRESEEEEPSTTTTEDTEDIPTTSKPHIDPGNHEDLGSEDKYSDSVEGYKEDDHESDLTTTTEKYEDDEVDESIEIVDDFEEKLYEEAPTTTTENAVEIEDENVKPEMNHKNYHGEDYSDYSSERTTTPKYGFHGDYAKEKGYFHEYSEYDDDETLEKVEEKSKENSGEIEDEDDNKTTTTEKSYEGTTTEKSTHSKDYYKEDWNNEEILNQAKTETYLESSEESDNRGTTTEYESNVNTEEDSDESYNHTDYQPKETEADQTETTTVNVAKEEDYLSTESSNKYQWHQKKEIESRIKIPHYDDDGYNPTTNDVVTTTEDYGYDSTTNDVVTTEEYEPITEEEDEYKTTTIKTTTEEPLVTNHEDYEWLKGQNIESRIYDDEEINEVKYKSTTPHPDEDNLSTTENDLEAEEHQTEDEEDLSHHSYDESSESSEESNENGEITLLMETTTVFTSHSTDEMVDTSTTEDNEPTTSKPGKDYWHHSSENIEPRFDQSISSEAYTKPAKEYAEATTTETTTLDDAEESDENTKETGYTEMSIDDNKSYESATITTTEMTTEVTTPKVIRKPKVMRVSLNDRNQGGLKSKPSSTSSEQPTTASTKNVDLELNPWESEYEFTEEILPSESTIGYFSSNEASIEYSQGPFTDYSKESRQPVAVVLDNKTSDHKTKGRLIRGR